MRIEPTPPPTGNFPSGGGPSLSAAAEATLFAQLATLAPTATSQAAATTPTGQQMTPQQINTYWLFRAFSDFQMLALTQNGHYPPTAYQPYLNDLKYILAQSNPPLSQDPSIMKDLNTYTTGTNYTTIPAQMVNIENDFMTIMTGQGTNPGNYNFVSFTPDQMFYFYNFQMAFALTNGSEIPDFWNNQSDGKTSGLGTNMGEFITTYFYEKNLNSDGTENYAALNSDLNAFMAQFNPMITAYGSGFQNDFPDIYNMLNGGIDEGGTPYAGLIKDIASFQTPGTWPFAGNPAPKIPLETPPPPWDNPNSQTPPIFIYPTGAYDPGCNFFTFVDNFLNQYFQS